MVCVIGNRTLNKSSNVSGENVTRGFSNNSVIILFVACHRVTQGQVSGKRRRLRSDNWMLLAHRP